MQGPAKLVSVYIDERDCCEGRPLHIAILEAARTHGVAGATVLRALAGYSHRSLRTARLASLASDQPVVVQLIDSVTRIQTFLPILKAMAPDRLVVVQDIAILDTAPVVEESTDGAGDAAA